MIVEVDCSTGKTIEREETPEELEEMANTDQDALPDTSHLKSYQERIEELERMVASLVNE